MTLVDERVAPAPPPARRPMRVAVYGLSRTGLIQAAALANLPGAELVAIGDPRPPARRNARGMGLGARPFSSPETLLAKAKPEALVLDAPPEARLRIARLAVAAGCPVLVNGTPALAARDAEALWSEARPRNAVVVVGHALAYHPVFAGARRALADGAVGAPRVVRTSYSASRVFHPAAQRARVAPGALGGVVAHAASDLMFLAVWMFGAPVAVTAEAQRVYGPHEDEVHGAFTLASGLAVGFDLSWSVPGYPRPATVIEVEGENGRLLASEDALELELRGPRAGFAAGATRLGRDALPQPARFELDGEAPWIQLDAFLAAAAGGAPAPTRLEVALPATRAVEALYASARGGGATLRIEAAPPDGGERRGAAA